MEIIHAVSTGSVIREGFGKQCGTEASFLILIEGPFRRETQVQFWRGAEVGLLMRGNLAALARRNLLTRIV
jgi:hypothetical protein